MHARETYDILAALYAHMYIQYSVYESYVILAKLHTSKDIYSLALEPLLCVVYICECSLDCGLQTCVSLFCGTCESTM